MKDSKESSVLHVLYNERVLNINQLVEFTGFSKSTMNTIIKHLNSRNLITISNSPSGGGRKPQLISLRENLLTSLGIEIGSQYMRAVIAKIDGTILASHIVERKSISHNRLAKPDLNQLVDEVLEKLKLTINDIHCIGIGISGFVDEFKEECLFLNRTPEWRNFPVKEYYGKEFNNPYISVKDSTNTMAVAEKMFGFCKNEDNFVYINIGMGIGASIYLFGKQVTGWNGLSSEIGHIDIGPGNVRCCCGNFGCLESIAGGWAIEERCEEALKMGTISSLNKNSQESEVNLSKIIEASLAGDKLSLSLIRESAQIMGKGISVIINLLNPKKIILSGGIVKGTGDLYIDLLKQEAQAHVLPWLRSSVNFYISELGEFDSALGAAMTATEEHLDKLIEEILA